MNDYLLQWIRSPAYRAQRGNNRSDGVDSLTQIVDMLSSHLGDTGIKSGIREGDRSSKGHIAGC